MQEELIGYPVAKLAREKGFNELCYAWFYVFRKGTPVFNGYEIIETLEEDEVHGLIGGQKGKTIGSMCDNDPITPNVIARPTQELLKKWLRETHKISIKVDDFYTNSKIRFDYSISKLGSQDDNPQGIFETYEEAFEKGLLKALKTIKDES